MYLVGPFSSKMGKRKLLGYYSPVLCLVCSFALLSLDSLSKLNVVLLSEMLGDKDLVAENHIQVHQARTKPFIYPIEDHLGIVL